MTWPFLLLPGDGLSTAELLAARLDGDVVEVGEAFMPADAVETAELRAASLRPLVPRGLAVTHESAAWVHGALAEAPARHSVQRCAAQRGNHVIDNRVRYRDLRLPQRDLVTVAGVPVTTPARTLGDLVRAAFADGTEPGAAALALATCFPGAASESHDLLHASGPVVCKRPALDWLRRRAAQEEVTRYTS
ncbi:MAG: SAM-dependent methyltransferase [Microbacterium arborescens]